MERDKGNIGSRSPASAAPTTKKVKAGSKAEKATQPPLSSSSRSKPTKSNEDVHNAGGPKWTALNSKPLEREGSWTDRASAPSPTREAEGSIMKAPTRKRKARTPEALKVYKSCRWSDRPRGTRDNPLPPTEPTPSQLVRYLLLNPHALELSQPGDEKSFMQEKKDAITYTTSAGGGLSPFQELVCALVMSRRISHESGMLTIRTIFNAPQDLTTPQKIFDAGEETMSQALLQAHAQRKKQTASELRLLAEKALRNFNEGPLTEKGGEQLLTLRHHDPADVVQERESLKSAIENLGETGLDIFFRRIQSQWAEVYPFIDDRTSKSLDRLGVPDEPDDLKNLIDQEYAGLINDGAIPDDGHYASDAQRKRQLFVRVLERAIGLDMQSTAFGSRVVKAKREAARG